MMEKAFIPNAESRQVLLAKKPRTPGSAQHCETLVGHTTEVFRVAKALLEVIGPQAVGSMGLSSELLSDLREVLLRGAALHDIGKANSQFQDIMYGSRMRVQALRHEWISTWVPFRFPELDEWLFSGLTPELRWSTLFSVLCHHLKVTDGSAISARAGGGEAEIDVLLGRSDVSECLELAGQELGLPLPPACQQVRIDLTDGQPLSELKNCLGDAMGWHQSASGEMRRFVALAKAMVISADVAGSAVPKEGIDVVEWTKRVLKRCCTSEDMEGVAKVCLKYKRPHKFQEVMSNSNASVSLVIAGCGTGKTVGAYMWAARHGGGRKVFFSYPTTGTATEGYRDYIVPSEIDADSALLHSRADCDLEDMVGTEDKRPEEITEHALRIESLTAWDVPLVICTADQVLGLIQNARRGLFSVPAIANASFVFDEIHQYDNRLFRALLRFLDAFCGAPMLLMTASLPVARLNVIRDKLEMLGSRLEVIEGPADLQNIKRYLIEGPEKKLPWDIAVRTLREGRKVLWVANTVNRCVGFAKEAQTRGLDPRPYHSRYRYCDRMDRHNAVIEAFRAPGSALAVTTQVCEVSLNLSSDLLVSDLAPVPSLIQRLGRLNRWATPENPGSPKPLVILEPSSASPYEDREMDQARAWLSELGSGPFSQQDLSAAFEKLALGPVSDGIESAWLDGGPFAAPAPLRESTHTISILREEDKSKCVDERSRPVTKEIARHSIPMLLGPVAREIGAWKRLGYAFVAPKARVEYSQQWGAEWTRR